jgi:hypothetical protein
LRAAFVARWRRGAFPPVDLRAVCFVLAIVQLLMLLFLMLLFYLCSCVCVFCGRMFHSCLMSTTEKREKALWQQMSTLLKILVLLYIPP